MERGVSAIEWTHAGELGSNSNFSACSQLRTGLTVDTGYYGN